MDTFEAAAGFERVLLWTLFAPEKLTPTVMVLVENSDNLLLVSPVSLWELAIKIALGKLSVAGPSVEPLLLRMQQLGPTMLPISLSHIQRLASLPHHHRDPFDRMLIAQALAEAVPFLTSDTNLHAYGAKLVWL